MDDRSRRISRLLTAMKVIESKGKRTNCSLKLTNGSVKYC